MMGTRKDPVPLGSTLRALSEFRFTLQSFLEFSREVALKAGSEPRQYQLLLHVAAAPPHTSVTIAYAAERLRVRHNSMAELVNRAERNGLISRKHDPADARRTLLRITREGQSLLDALAKQHAHELTVLAPELIKSLRQIQQSGIQPRTVRSRRDK